MAANPGDPADSADSDRVLQVPRDYSLRPVGEVEEEAVKKGSAAALERPDFETGDCGRQAQGHRKEERRGAGTWGEAASHEWKMDEGGSSVEAHKSLAGLLCL